MRMMAACTVTAFWYNRIVDFTQFLQNNCGREEGNTFLTQCNVKVKAIGSKPKKEAINFDKKRVRRITSNRGVVLGGQERGRA